ncbi:MAG TPA: hypothetical protein VFO19_06315 [Vicinamibacterales bacterium]|nr:hypothetical protein [Vicinamibacterales bacterium]
MPTAAARAIPRLGLVAAICAWPALAAAQTPAVATPPPAATAPPPAVHAQQQQQHEMGQQLVEQREYPSLRLVGFGDVNFSVTDKSEGVPRNFSLGQFALHLTSELSSRVTFFGELSFTARTDAGTGTPPAPGFNAEVERMIIRFDQSDKLKVSFGRYHTPINYWNTAFHHGQWLQTTISRPEMTQFGGRFIPVHFIGGLVEGAIPAAGLNLNYKGGIGNGRATAISRGGDAGDVNDDIAWLANAFIKPDRLYGLQVGGAFYHDTITTATEDIGEDIVSAHAVWAKEEPELIFEYAGVRHEAPGASATWSQAYYVQAAYRLPYQERKWKPYFRFEHIGIEDGDDAFATVPELDGVTLGLRFDLSLYAAVKGEYRTWTRGTDSVRNHGGFFQVCFTF